MPRPFSSRRLHVCKGHEDTANEALSTLARRRRFCGYELFRCLVCARRRLRRLRCWECWECSLVSNRKKPGVQAVAIRAGRQGLVYRSNELSSRPCCVGVEKSGEHSEREDCGGMLCGGMARIAGSHIVGSAKAARAFSAKHLAPWLGHRLADLERAECADLCAHVGALSRLFMDIDTTTVALRRDWRRSRSWR
jgi:hypothetical protein